MNVDLFDRTTASYEVADDLFGIQDEHPAIVTTEGDAKEWNAVVRNSSGDKITFVPLDHQIVIKPTPSTTYSLCDCMLYRDKYWLAVVELKNQASSWIEDAISQLKSTIDVIENCPQASVFTRREAYAANRKHPAFSYSAKSRMNDFRNKTKFRLIITNEIIVK